MARIRTIKPEFWGDSKTARLSRDARLLFLGLLNESDDEGRQLGAPRRIAGVVFPHDADITPEIVGALLDELEAERMVERYDVDGTSYLLIVGFTKHQKVSHPSKSHLPPPALLRTSGDSPGISGGDPERLTPDLGGDIQHVEEKVSGVELEYQHHQPNPAALSGIQSIFKTA